MARIAPLNGLGNGKSRPAPDMLTARTESELEADFATMVQNRIGALIVMPDPFFMSRRERLVELVARDTVPAIYPSRVFTDVGGLISYGSSVLDLNRELGIYVGKILKGAKPVDLPIQQSTKVELVINLKTAKALGLTVPPSLLARADEVIERQVGSEMPQTAKYVRAGLIRPERSSSVRPCRAAQNVSVATSNSGFSTVSTRAARPLWNGFRALGARSAEDWSRMAQKCHSRTYRPTPYPTGKTSKRGRERRAI